jgi:hypothetical protein
LAAGTRRVPLVPQEIAHLPLQSTLNTINDVSDVDIVERSKFGLSFNYFLDMAPKETVIDPSSLINFRNLRLKDLNLLDMLINKSVEIAIEKKIINSKSIIVDASHTKGTL